MPNHIDPLLLDGITDIIEITAVFLRFEFHVLNIELVVVLDLDLVRDRGQLPGHALHQLLLSIGGELVNQVHILLILLLSLIQDLLIDDVREIRDNLQVEAVFGSLTVNLFQVERGQAGTFLQRLRATEVNKRV